MMDYTGKVSVLLTSLRDDVTMLLFRAEVEEISAAGAGRLNEDA